MFRGPRLPIGLFLLLGVLLLGAAPVVADSPAEAADSHLERASEQATQAPDQAIELARRALALFNSSGDLRGQAESLLLLGLLNQEQGEALDAATWYRDSRERLEELADPLGAWLLSLLASEAHDEGGQPKDSLEDLERALELLSALEEHLDQASLETFEFFSRQAAVSDFECLRGSTWQTFKVGFPFFRGMLVRAFRSLTLKFLGDRLSDLGRLKEAMETYRGALSLFPMSSPFDRREVQDRLEELESQVEEEPPF